MEPFIGQVMLFAGTFAPRGWAFCDGQLLSIDQNPSLFSLIGTTYGGDGRTTFALPDLRGRAPIHAGQGPGLDSYRLGQPVGDEAIGSSGTGAAHPNVGSRLAMHFCIALTGLYPAQN